MIMCLFRKKQKQKAGNNSIQQQIETQNNYVNIYNNIQPTEDVTDNKTGEDQREELTIEGCNTSLWKKTLGNKNKNAELLKKSYLQARENAKQLLAKVKKEFPKLIVPDITHIDSLWTIADTIIGENYLINPLEGYVLGIAFLIHDAALSCDAVEGKKKLESHPVWKDAKFDFLENSDAEDFNEECDVAALHILHEMNSKRLLFDGLEDNKNLTVDIDGTDPYLNYYKDLIRKISACQFWSISDVEIIFNNQDNPMVGMPKEWVINTLKLACILRCAVAGHIDNGRIPVSIYGLLYENCVSQHYWEKNIRLSQVCEDVKDKTKLCIKSQPFGINDFAAWNATYDAIRLLDEELKKSNELLRPAGLSFPHIGVTGAESKEALSEHIRTNGWQPCDFGIHTSNVKALIENLGGSKLYGEDSLLLVALRELIQNARDAIHARRTMDGCLEEGRITIRLKEEAGRRWIEVEDNGIGMSLDCIKNHLLDFGSSYWKSNLAKYDFPGLRSKGFKSIGKFGIGFYSVFMVAKSVEVVTRRYNKGTEAMKVEFPKGLTLSPIMSKDQLSTSVSTIVRFELKDDVYLSFSVNYYDDSISFQKALQIVVAGLDADVYYEKDDGSQFIHTNIKSNKFNEEEWLKGVLIQTLIDDEVEHLSKRLKMLSDETGDIVAYLAIPDKDYGNIVIPSIETVCGLATSIDNIGVSKGFVGVVICKEADVSRNDFILDKKTSKILQDWLKEKYNDEYDRIVASDVLSKYYYRAMSYCGMSLNEIEDNNMKVLYATYQLKNIEIGTIKGLKDIHMMLFSGISDFAGRYRVHEVSFYNSYMNKKFNAVGLEILDETLRTIDEMSEDSFEDIILKYLQLMEAHPFTDGNGRAGRIWVNLMLKRLNGEMIDWRKIDNKEFYKKMELFNENKLVEPMCDFLRGCLSKEYEKEIIAEAINTF